MAYDMPRPCKFPSLDSCQKRFPWTHKEVDLALHPVVGLVLQVGDMEKCPHAPGFESWDPFFRVSKQAPRFRTTEENGGDLRLIQFNLLAKLMVLHHQILFSLAIAEAILIWTSTKQVPPLHRVAPRYLKLVTSSNF